MNVSTEPSTLQSSKSSILFLATVLLLSGILRTDLVEDDAVVFAFNDLQAVRTPRAWTLLKVSMKPRTVQRVVHESDPTSRPRPQIQLRGCFGDGASDRPVSAARRCPL